jgi:carbon monoxide dehydrogenase subunit G
MRRPRRGRFSVPEASVTFHSASLGPRLRELLSDPAFVASIMPEVVKVEKTGPATANWTVRLTLGPLKRESQYQGELLSANDVEVRFRATGPEAVVEGTVAFAAAPAGGTEVTVTLAANGRGALRAVVDAYLAKRVKDDVRRFATSLEARVAQG